MFNIGEELKKLPNTPGVYLHKNSLGEIIYVGKAVNLKRRVSSYFSSSKKQDPKVRAMVSNIKEFEYINCVSELEALVLESNLIKEYMPKYNVLMKDDKSYPYIDITLSEKFPRVIITRNPERNGNKYYGPYSDVGSARVAVQLIEQIYPIKKCSNLSFPKSVRPCLYYHIGRCCGICTGDIKKDDYMRMIREIMEFLGGRETSIVKKLEKKMKDASLELRFEDAAVYRDYLKAINSIGEMQRATNISNKDIDILIPINTYKNNAITKYKVREGKLVDRSVCYMENANDDNYSDMIPEFIKQHYVDKLKLPREILLEKNNKEEKILTEFLNEINKKNYEMKYDGKHKTKFYIPERGSKKALIELARVDAIKLKASLDARAEREDERKLEIKRKITSLIERASGLRGRVPRTLGDEDEKEYRIEAYDVSNMNGIDTVSAMVVYEGLKPVKKDYRKFKIRLSSGDDYAALDETLTRRLRRTIDGDAGFKEYPDIVFVDGGLGQVRTVIKAMERLSISIPAIGLAKDDSHRTRAIVFEDGSEISLKEDRILYNYAGAIQEEVHRFAITYQRNTRGKRMIKSVLEEIDGVGEKRRKMLLDRFKNIDNIKNASYEDLLEVKGITREVAHNIVEFFAADL